MNGEKTVVLLILFVNWWLRTKDPEKPLRKVSALQLLVKEEHWPFLGCPYLSHVVLCKACFGLYFNNSKSWVLTLLQLSV